MKHTYILVCLFLFISACSSGKIYQTTSDSGYQAFTGATILNGQGGTPIKDGVLLIRKGQVVAVGPRNKVKIPEVAIIEDVTGKFIMPGIINGHGHVGDVKGIEPGHYSRENLLDNLGLYGRYGITTVVSLGGDKKEAEPLRAIHDSTTTQRARLFIAGEVITGKTPAEALAVVEQNHRLGVDFMKIRVDDQLGTAPKMPAAVYRAVIKRSHQLGYKIATHLYSLADARDLLLAGSDLLAHSVRDQPVDAAFIQLLKKKKAGYCPTLTRELSTFVYGDTAAFFQDPFFRREYDSLTIQPLIDPARQSQMRQSKSAQTYQQQLPTAMANLKKLSDQGIPIVFGTDSGMPARFMGYFEHLEMEMMAEAGLTPRQIITAATKNAAHYLGLKNVGTLTRGNWADFLVLDADPLTDIRNVRKLNGVFISGEKVEK
ncbi:amidohydrolase family protein [Adhaeribacter pallidiroseus]|uniref:Enamidase n=1 Tax=Adhaeribacter pallidiroseus TaxID=2072847 RepID=A0A369QGU7_9BACT|nr:amidohydrolase family protein [Adhaeribacter pallidiroseus]RDC62775.1 Enamidase [Adhaeribacter pallidiroseus]